ncbi:NACHT, LRR and PYD domains-containing protein 3-like [Aquarana catesbeiana]|uniref:NACHT, LRR and PYD domains-containing protein 3-like n=1 Tax=Aquarana catesbeiana TaxID=8400 RepID=UPI003CC9831F
MHINYLLLHDDANYIVKHVETAGNFLIACRLDIRRFRHQLSAYDDPSLRRIYEYYRDDLIHILENVDTEALLKMLKFRKVLNTDKYRSIIRGSGVACFSHTLLQDIGDQGRETVIGLWKCLYELQNDHPHPNLLSALDEITQTGEGLVKQILLDEFGHSLTPELRDIQEKHKQYLMEKTETLVEHRPPGTTLEPQRFLINERYVDLIVVSTDQFRERPQNEIIQTGVKHEECLKETQTRLEHISPNKLFRWNPQSHCVPHVVMVSGVPGIGKTTLMQKFVYDWVTGKHYQRFAFLFFFRFRDLNRLGEVSLEEMILHQYPYLQSQIGDILQDPEILLFIFDGLDESIHQMDFRSSKLSNPKRRSHFSKIVVSLVRQSLLKGPSVLITSRPTRLASVDTSVFQRIAEIMGFLHGDRLIFFNNFFGNEELSEKAFHYVQENDMLYTFCYIPSYCWIICTVLSMCFRSQPTITDQLMTSLPKTVTQLFVVFVSNILANHSQNKDGGHTARELLTSIGWMAEHGVMNHIIVFDDRHLESFSVRDDNHVFSSFMMESGQPPDVDYTFLHLTLQEFFAALVHFMNYNPDRLQKTLDKAESYKDGRAEIFLRFLCGLSDSSTRSMLKSHVGELSTQAARHVITWIQKKITDQRYGKSTEDKRKLLNVFYYLYESRNKALVAKCIGSNKVDFSEVPLSPLDCSVLSFILKSCREIEVDVNSCNILSEGLRKFIPALHNIKSLRGIPGQLISRLPKTINRQEPSQGNRKRKHRRKRKGSKHSSESTQWATEESEKTLNGISSSTSTDMSIVNLSDFQMDSNHLKLLQKGLSFSPTAPMNEFEVFKDINLFLRKVLFKLWHHNNPDNKSTPDSNLDKDENEAINNLMALLEENANSDSETENSHPIRRKSNLRIKSTKMPALSKHKWLQLFLDQVKLDLGRINWEWLGSSNLTSSEKKALKELQEAPNLVIKRSDKGGNVVLLSEKIYEDEAFRLLSDTSTYQQLMGTPFPALIDTLNTKLKLAMEAGLLTKKEYLYLRADDITIPTFYIIPKLHKSLTNPPGRPIVSAINGPLERPGKFVDSMIKNMEDYTCSISFNFFQDLMPFYWII